MKRTLTLLIAALALVAAGCGGDDNESSSSDTGAAAAPTQTETTPSSGGGGASTQLKISADPSGQLKFDKTKLNAKAGKVSIVMDNPSDVPHAVEIEGNGVEEEGETVTKGGTSTATADVKPGSYEFYCPVDGHKAAGMEGTLTVK
jgi:uncharacterized cupredoxin-like copper-binding protein